VFKNNKMNETEYLSQGKNGEILRESINQVKKTVIDIRLHQRKGSMGSSIQVNYGKGWENIKIHIEK